MAVISPCYAGHVSMAVQSSRVFSSPPGSLNPSQFYRLSSLNWLVKPELQTFGRFPEAGPREDLRPFFTIKEVGRGTGQPHRGLEHPVYEPRSRPVDTLQATRELRTILQMGW